MPSSLSDPQLAKDQLWEEVQNDPEVLRRIRRRRRPERETSEALARLPHTTTPEVAQRAQATENTWRNIEKEFGLLTSAEVADRVGKAGRSYAHQRRTNGDLLAVRRGGRDYYPGFQVTPTGPVPLMAELAAEASELGVREASVLLWMVAPATWWDGLGPESDNRPVDHLDDPDEVLAAFRSTFGDQG